MVRGKQAIASKPLAVAKSANKVIVKNNPIKADKDKGSKGKKGLFGIGKYIWGW